MPVKSLLYDRDFLAWSHQQAEFLRSGKLAEADNELIAEEIESMGRTGRRGLISGLSAPAPFVEMEIPARTARTE